MVNYNVTFLKDNYRGRDITDLLNHDFIRENVLKKIKTIGGWKYFGRYLLEELKTNNLSLNDINSILNSKNWDEKYIKKE